MLHAARRRIAILLLLTGVSLLGGGAGALLGTCGPFTDVAADSFCPFVLEVFTMGITTGTTPTTYEPGAKVTRVQMGTFLTRSVDSLARRNALQTAYAHFWSAQAGSFRETNVGDSPVYCRSNGRHVAVSNLNGNSVTVLKASDGKVLETLTGIPNPYGTFYAKGRLYVATTGGKFYEAIPLDINPPTLVASDLGVNPRGLTWDGSRFFTANGGPPGSVSIITPGATIPWTVTTVVTGFDSPHGMVFTGDNVWVSDFDADTIKRLGPNGEILQTVSVGDGPRFPMYDGINIWIPNFSSASVTVVRASSGAVLATLSGNGLGFPTSAAHNGDIVLVSNHASNTVSKFKLADLSARGSFSTGAGTQPFGACTDGFHKFWMTFATTNKVATFF
jgi:hypothetical protein